MSDVWANIAAVDASLARIAKEQCVDLDALCEQASEAFDPIHRPGDPVTCTDEEIAAVVREELRY